MGTNQAALLKKIRERMREELGEPHVTYPQAGIVKIMIENTHLHDEEGIAREFSFEAKSEDRAAELVFKNKERMCKGAFCPSDCTYYRPPRDSDL